MQGWSTRRYRWERRDWGNVFSGLAPLLSTTEEKVSPRGYEKFISSMLEGREAGHCLIRLARKRAVLNELRLRAAPTHPRLPLHPPLPPPASPLCVESQLLPASHLCLSVELGRGWDGREEGSQRGLEDSSSSCSLGTALLLERPVFFLLGLPELRTRNTGAAFEPEVWEGTRAKPDNSLGKHSRR